MIARKPNNGQSVTSAPTRRVSLRVHVEIATVEIRVIGDIYETRETLQNTIYAHRTIRPAKFSQIVF